MLKQISNSLVKLIGDPHLGKKFITDVPLDRRGEREKFQGQKFLSELHDLDKDGVRARTCIIMGDLFQDFEVPSSVVYQAFQALASAAILNEDVTYVILQGNHDVTRNTSSKSSLELLECMLGHINNILIVREVEIVITADGSDPLLMVPYDAFTSAKDLVELQLPMINSAFQGRVAAAFGHWDIEQFDEDNTHNLVPKEQLCEITDLIVTGHVHKYQEKDLGDGKTLLVTGSMLPYSHGEDPNGVFYTTVTLKEYNDAVEKDPRVFHDKSLRILLEDGEEPPVDFDCYQFAIKRGKKVTTSEDVEVVIADFSFKKLYDECMKDNAVEQELSDSYWDRYQELTTDASQD